MKKGLLPLCCCLLSFCAPVWGVMTYKSEQTAYIRLNAGPAFLNGRDMVDTGTYEGRSVGTIQPSQSFGIGYQADFGLGYQFNRFFRSELAVGYIYNDMESNRASSDAQNVLNSGYTHSTTVMVNAYYDIANDTDFTPYLGVGIGYLKNYTWFRDGTAAYPASPIITYSGTGNYFAQQILAGTAYNFTKDFSMLLDYRLLLFPKETVTYTNNPGTFTGRISYNGVYNLVSIGLKYNFG